MRNYLPYTALALMACGGDWLTGPGTPLELSHQSLEGRWVNVLVVTSLVGNPSIAYRFEQSPDEGEIVEFDGSGGVSRPGAWPGWSTSAAPWTLYRLPGQRQGTTLAPAKLAAQQECQATDQGQRDLLATILNHRKNRIDSTGPELVQDHDVRQVSSDCEQHQYSE